MANFSAPKVLKTTLAVVGALALALAAFGLVAFYRGLNTSDSRDTASPEDLVHVLNWAALPPTQNFKVLHSFTSARSFGGDHVDGYCISLENVTLDADWKTAAALEKPFLDAVVFGLGFAAQELSCLPSSEELVTRKILIKPFSLNFSSAHPRSGEVIFLDPATKELYFVSFKV